MNINFLLYLCEIKHKYRNTLDLAVATFNDKKPLIDKNISKRRELLHLWSTVWAVNDNTPSDDIKYIINNIECKIMSTLRSLVKDSYKKNMV